MTINERKGSFPGILKERKFNIIKVYNANGTGDGVVERFDEKVNYGGQKVVIKL